jgi:hypothetical protein
MAIRFFKEVVDSKGYRIDSKDREIFEREDLQSFFGLSDSDAIEFVLYDANDNQLPQSNYGMARYIPLTTQNIGDYFLIAEGTLFQAFYFPNEYFIDIERLIKEAGYDNGIFKTQITLINKRVGSDSKYDKLWISEISPSRTEVRLLPLKRKETVNTELFERYGIFLNDGEFREDTIAYAINFIEKINPSIISSSIKSKYGSEWFDKMRAEFKIKAFESFVTDIHNKFMQSALYEFTNRISDLRDLNYGKPKQTKPKLELSKSKIKDMCFNLIIRAIDFYLLTPDIVGRASADIATDESKDIVGQVLQRTKSDTQIDTTNPEIVKAQRVKVKQKDADIKLALEIKKEDPPIAPPNVEPTPPPIYKKPIDVDYSGTPVYSGGGGSRGGGGGGSSDYFERGGGYGREQVFERDMNQRENLQ